MQLNQQLKCRIMMDRVLKSIEDCHDLGRIAYQVPPDLRRSKSLTFPLMAENNAHKRRFATKLVPDSGDALGPQELHMTLVETRVHLFISNMCQSIPDFSQGRGTCGDFPAGHDVTGRH